MSSRPQLREPQHENALLAAIQALTSIIVVAIFIVTFAVQPFRIPSSSMVPTLLVGDFLLVDKQTANLDSFPLPSGKLHRGDVIVFRFPPNPSLHLVKRVVGLPGERIRLQDEHVFINGAPIVEPYAVYHASPPDSFRDNFPSLDRTDPGITPQWWLQLRRLEDHGELRIPAGQYFVLGDNRNNSEDSRYWGLVPAEAVVGKPLLVYLSLRETSRDAPHPQRSSSAPDSTFTQSLAGLARWQRAFHVIH